MLRSRLFAALAVIGAVMTGLPASAMAEPELFPSDPRLDRPMTVQRGRVYLGELAEQLSRSAGIPLRISDTRGPVDGNHLTVFLKGMPLRKVMAGLRSLFDTRYDRWEWRKEGSGYLLHHQRSPEAAYAAARQELLAKWAADVRAYHAIGRAPQPQRAALAAERHDLFPQGEIRGNKLDLFAKLTPGQVESALRGAEIPVDSSRLTEQERSALRFTFGGTPTGDSPPPEPPPPGFWVGWNGESIGPVLWLRGEGGGSVSVVGGSGWEGAWFLSEGDGWRFRRDPEVLAFQEGTLRGETGRGVSTTDRTVPDWLKRAAERQGLNVMYDHVYPGSQRGEARGWLGHDPKQTLLALVLRRGLTWKHEGEIDLLRHKSASIHPRRHLLPWKQIRTLRAAAEQNDGMLRIPDLLQLTEMTPDQLAGLEEEFPTAHKSGMSELRPIVLFYTHLDPKSQEQLASLRGIRLKDTGLVARAALSEGGDPRKVRNLEFLEQNFNQVRVSLRIEPVRLPDPKAPMSLSEQRVLYWRTWVPGGKDRDVPFRLMPRKPLKPE